MGFIITYSLQLYLKTVIVRKVLNNFSSSYNKTN